MLNSGNSVKDLSPKRNAYALSNNLAKNKTPGSDGLTVRVEFYLCFWEYVATSLKDCLNDAYITLVKCRSHKKRTKTFAF